MAEEVLEGYDSQHGCRGCIYDEDTYLPECKGCRCRSNLYFNTVKELEEFKSLPIKFVSDGSTTKVSYGTHRILVRK